MTSGLETEGLFWFRRFINLSLTNLLRHLLTYNPRPTRGTHQHTYTTLLVIFQVNLGHPMILFLHQFPVPKEN